MLTQPTTTQWLLAKLPSIAAVVAAAWIAGSSAAMAQAPTATSPADRPQAAAGSTDTQRLHAQYEELLQLLQANRVNLADDPLTDLIEKYQAIQAGLEKHQQETLRHFLNPEQVGANYVQFLNAAGPRLTGRIVRIGPDGDFADLASARAGVQAGDLICLGEGSFSLDPARGVESTPWADVAIVGAGPGKTTLTGQIRSAQRLRIEGVAVDCANHPFVNLRRGGTLHLRDCTFSGYNSGSGGSNAIAGNESVILIERCSFEGKSGRAASASSQGGNVFDLRGFNLLYVRQAQFIDNDEIIRATYPAVFDGCTTRNVTAGHTDGIKPYPSGWVLHRRNEPALNVERNASTFTHATDDPQFVRLLLGESGAADESARALADALGLAESQPYWIGLLRHENAELRAMAQAQVGKLTGQPIAPMETTERATCPNPLATPLAAEAAYTRLMTWYEQSAHP